tara:strand:+ start:149 stop:796 length:648 start_codon:yes stop_codon:yes gene_type:complete
MSAKEVKDTKIVSSKSNAPKTNNKSNKSNKPPTDFGTWQNSSSGNNSPRNSPQPKKSKLATFREKSREAAEARKTSDSKLTRRVRKGLYWVPFINTAINLFVLGNAFATIWYPADEMPYRPLLLFPAMGFAFAQLFYLWFNYGWAEKIVIQQLIYMCILMILTALAVAYPQRTCCERTAKEQSIRERFYKDGPTCSGSPRERKVDGVWVKIDSGD